jgi:hypothetical protein
VIPSTPILLHPHFRPQGTFTNYRTFNCSMVQESSKRRLSLFKGYLSSLDTIKREKTRPDASRSRALGKKHGSTEISKRDYADHVSTPIRSQYQSESDACGCLQVQCGCSSITHVRPMPIATASDTRSLTDQCLQHFHVSPRT